MVNPEVRLKELGLSLPRPSGPVGSYLPFVQAGDLLFVSGQLPMRDGQLVAKGKVGGDVSLELAREAARQAILNALAQVAAAADSLDRVVRIVRVGVFVNSGSGFTDQAKVANGASELLVSVFGDAGRHARAAVGVNELPLDAAVEIDLIVQVRQ
ncbi:MAG TPA: RidA family protein [Phycisphaerae bacterium]|nr:RidA family protein [Phycisphaerae bacterium]